MKKRPLLLPKALSLCAVLCLAAFGPLPVQAARSPAPKPPSDLEADRLLYAAMLERDRGEADVAIARLQELLKLRPDFVEGHRLYMEAAALSRRNGRLVEAEYRHLLAQGPDDPLRGLLHAAATMTRELCSSDPVSAARIAEVESRIEQAQAHPSTRVDAHLLAADLARLRRDHQKSADHVRAAFEEAPKRPGVLQEKILLLVAEGDLDEAADHCLSQLRRAPWRASVCAEVFPRRAGEAAPTEKRQEQIEAELRRQEKRAAKDPVVLQGLESFYAAVEDRSGRRRLRDSLRQLDPNWRAPLDRDPYLAPLKEGELTDEEVLAVSRLDVLSKSTKEDPFARVQALDRELEEREMSPRVRAMYFRQKAYALRDPQVLDRDGSRAAIAAALKAQPDDPHILNEWAYLSALDQVDLAEALVAVDRALKLLLGEPFDLRGLELGEAFSDWELSRAESVGAFVDTRGWILYHLGRHKEAAQQLELASLLSSDGTVHGHLGMARYALGNDNGALHNLLRALALGTEEEPEIYKLAQLVYEKGHIVPGGLDALVEETRAELREDALPFWEPGRDMREGLSPPSGLDLPEAAERGEDATRNPDHPLLGLAAPLASYRGLDGRARTTADMAGKVIVLDFWATWCGPCLEALPALEALAQTFEGAPVHFLALSVDEEAPVVQNFFSERKAAFEVGLADEGVAETFSVQGIPSTFVIDQAGKVVAHHQGFEPAWVGSMTQELISLLELLEP